MPKSNANTSTRTPTRAQGNTSKGSRSASGRGRSSSRSGPRLGGTGHVEVIPFRPHHSWWIQLLLLVWRWTPEPLLAVTVAWDWRRTTRAGWPRWGPLPPPPLGLARLLAGAWSRRGGGGGGLV